MTTCSTTECGTGLGSVILPSDPSNNATLSATPAFGGIDVSWSMPTTNPHAVAYVNLYRGVLNNPNAALLIATVGGNTYYDKSPTALSVEYFYWIRFISVNGTIGELLGPASAVARPTIDEVIEGLTQKIDYGTLGTALKSKIDDIGLNYQTLLQEVGNRQAGEVAFSQTLALVQTTVDNALLYINQEITARQDGDSALAQQVNTVATVSGNNLAAVQETLQTNITQVNDTVTEIGALYTVKVGVNGLVGGFGVYNNGSSVEAGFDVDTFWVGRTGPDKKKPFIISGNEVFINQAVIANASIDAAKINKATISALSALNADLGLITAGQIRFNKPGDPNSTLIIDAASQTLQVWNAGVLRVKIGNLA
jgi:hypothetical protein